MGIFNKNPGSNPIIGFIPYALFVGILLTTLISIVSSLRWNIFLELLCNFKFQYLLLNLLLFGLLVLTRQKKLIIISLFCLSIVFVEIAPWYIPKTGIEINNPTQ